MSAETPSAAAVRKAWQKRGYDDGLKVRLAAVTAVRARGGELAVAAYLTGYNRGRRAYAERAEES